MEFSPEFIYCPNCSCLLKLNEKERTRVRISCPKCSSTINLEIANSPEYLPEHTNCIFCNSLLKLNSSERILGSDISCPVCKKTFNNNRNLIQNSSTTSLATQSRTIKNIDVFDIPEPTRSLLWVTDDDPELAENPMSIGIVITITPDGIDAKDKEKGFYSEPSLIWKQAPIKENSDLRKKALYWPSYMKLSPEERYQYLRWLSNITQPTNLSYVFLYFYGLERHLLIGNYDIAVDEISKLLQYHPKGSFVNYATTSLIVASLAKKRMDIIKRVPSILEQETDEALALRIMKGGSMTPDDIISLASRVGFMNRNYLNRSPKLFKQFLSQSIREYEEKNGVLLTSFDPKAFRLQDSGVFANLSIPEQYRVVKVPQIIENTNFKKTIRGLLESAHKKVKENKKIQKL